MTFDRLVYVDKLKQAGVEESVARAHAEALRDALLDTVATKTDLNELRSALKMEVGDLRSELKAEISELRSDMGDLRSELKAEIKALEYKIELSARDLTIKGAGALVILASLMIGLKPFG